jgi:hypothetical protein
VEYWKLTRKELEHIVYSTALTIINDKGLYTKAKATISSSRTLGKLTTEEALEDSGLLNDYRKGVPVSGRMDFRRVLTYEVAHQLGIGCKYGRAIWEDAFKYCKEINQVDATWAYGRLKADCIIIDDLIDKPKEETIEMKITKPVLVNGIDILTASDDVLVELIRKAKAQLKADEDMIEVSQKFQKKALELKDIINQCVAQLDKEPEA